MKKYSVQKDIVSAFTHYAGDILAITLGCQIKKYQILADSTTMKYYISRLSK